MPFSGVGGLSMFQVLEDVDDVEDFSGKFFQGEGEVGHTCSDLIFCHAFLSEGNMMIV
jgi:hypothetical protein